MYNAISKNKRNTLLIMALFVGLITAIGYVVGYMYGDYNIAYYFIGGAVLYAALQYFISDKLAVAMTGAHEIAKKDNPRLYRIVENLSITDGLPMPKVYLIDDPAPNAFATGRDPKHSIVAATTGLLEIMNDSELEAVMAHEMGHVKNYDIRVSMIACGLSSVIGMLSDLALRGLFFSDNDNDNSPIAMLIGAVLLILSPIIALLIQLAVSRQREYLADATSAMTTRNPDAMVSALKKLKEFGKPLRKQSTSTAHMFINDPLKPGFVGKMFSTHPPIDERIARLQKNADKF